jgi:hypothetical protein
MNNVGFAELVLCAGWYIWWERRKKVHNEEIQTPFRSATSIVVITKNYMMAAKKAPEEERSDLVEAFGGHVEN